MIAILTLIGLVIVFFGAESIGAFLSRIANPVIDQGHAVLEHRKQAQMQADVKWAQWQQRLQHSNDMWKMRQHREKIELEQYRQQYPEVFKSGE